MFNLYRTSLPLLLCGMLLGSCAVNQPSPDAGDRTVSDVSVAQARMDATLPAVDVSMGSVKASRQSAGDSADDSLAVAPADDDFQPYDGVLVRWGGSIAGLSNRADGSTVVELVSRPLLGGGRPAHDDRSDGRFLAVIDTFLDPEIIKAGRDMTVLGQLAGRADGKVGNTPYVFPVVAVTDYRYWKAAVPVAPPYFPHWNAYYPYSPYYRYDPFWHDWPFMPPPRK